MLASNSEEPTPTERSGDLHRSGSEIALRADFSVIRYAQCWEDADILLAALDPLPGHTCLSVASAGDNTLALLSREPAHVIALDLNPAQLACLELRVAAYRQLSHPELLAFVGARPCERRQEHYARCRPHLPSAAQAFWDTHQDAIDQGFGNSGRFERYLRIFGTRILPLLQSKRVRQQLLRPQTRAERERFYSEQWDTWRWRALYQIFFSRRTMGWLGRDPSFFAYVEGDVATRLLARTKYAMTVLDPVQNPYLQWIILGTHGPALPYALRPENFQPIRENLDRLEIRCQSLEDYLAETHGPRFDRFNLSNIFEYMSEGSYAALLQAIVRSSRLGARLAYWNMMVPRSRPQNMAHQLRSLNELSDTLFRQDKAFFYTDFVVEEVI